jgi:hypothetical protein
LGGDFIHIGPNLHYVGGDEEISEIERDKLSLQEVKGHLKDHLELKESMKLHFLVPGKELVDGLQFLYDDSGCVKMVDYICVGGVAEIYVEYHGEEDGSDNSSSCSDFEDEIVQLLSDEEPDMVITAENEPVDQREDDDVRVVQQVLVTDNSAMVTEVFAVQ